MKNSFLCVVLVSVLQMQTAFAEGGSQKVKHSSSVFLARDQAKKDSMLSLTRGMFEEKIKDIKAEKEEDTKQVVSLKFQPEITEACRYVMTEAAQVKDVAVTSGATSNGLVSGSAGHYQEGQCVGGSCRKPRSMKGAVSVGVVSKEIPEKGKVVCETEMSW